MAVISNNTFDPLRRYVGVRLQEGVPIVDADWNELEDMRRFEVRAYLKWFVGDGVPEGNDGFRIIGQGQLNDFLVSAGPTAVGPLTDHGEIGLRQVGRFLADGLDVIVDKDIAFRAQPLHTSQPGAAALAARLGVPVITEAPVIDGTVLVYLDVWERLVTPAEDTTLIFPGLATESCARNKREWAVRVRQAADVPKSPDSDWRAGHSYVALARLLRRATTGNVNASDVTDLRVTRLLVPPASIVEDTLGTTMARYRQGLDRPSLSLRDAVNAFARGEVPALPELPVNATMTGPQEFSGRGSLDGANGLVLTWAASTGVANVVQVFVGQLDLGNPGAGFTATPAITSGISHSAPSVALLSNGDLLVAYAGQSPPPPANNTDVYFRRASKPAGLVSATEVPVTTSKNAAKPFVVASGDVVVFFFQIAGSNWSYQRYNSATNLWLDAGPQPVVVNATNVNQDLHAAVDGAGFVWVAGTQFVNSATPPNALMLRMNPTTGVQDAPAAFAGTAGDTYQAPAVVATPAKGGTPAQVWVFWHGSNGISYANCKGTTWSFSLPQMLPYTVPGDAIPMAAVDGTGRLVIAYQRVIPPLPSVKTNIVVAYGDPTNGGFLPPIHATASLISDHTDGMLSAGGSLWLVWTRATNLIRRLWYRRICNPL